MFPRFSMSRNLVELGPERPDKKLSKKFKGQRDVGLQQMLCLGRYGEWWERVTQNLSKWCGVVS